MAEKTFPVGSIVKVGEHKAIVTGIVFDEIGDAVRSSAFVKRVNNETGDWEFVTEQTVD